MIRSLEIKLAAPAGAKLTQSACSLLHGVLMEHIDSTYAELLHQQSLRPYSQYLYFDKERDSVYWRLTSLNKQADDELLGAAFSLPATVYLKKKQMEVQLVSKEYLKETSYAEIAEKCFAQPLAGKYLSCNFLTSCSFKSEGQYVIFPQPQFLLGSLIKRWNSFADKERLDALGLAQDLPQETYVADYKLSLHSFSVDGARIPAFRGLYVLGMKNNVMCNRIIAMLGEYANYSGIGIKTALGMGAVKTSLNERF